MSVRREVIEADGEPATLEELIEILVAGYDDACTDLDRVYDLREARRAIDCTARTLFRKLSTAKTDSEMAGFIRRIAATEVRKKK